jgi:L-iditol 2-dehydrogenase
MQACLINNKGQVGVENVPIPSLRPGEILVKLAAAGICGTDIEKAHGRYGPGGILGHEVSGTIERIGEGGVTGLTAGERVLAHHHVPCYNCHYCLHGDHTMCDLFKKTNFDPCGLAEFFRVPETNVERGAVIPLPTAISFEEAAIIEPTACCVRALEKAQVKPGESVLIAGLGPTGLTQIQLLKKMGASHIIGADLLAHRLEMGLKLGASETIDTSTTDVSRAVIKSTHKGADLVIVSTGNPRAIQQSLAAVRKGGRLLLFGAPPQGSTIELDVGGLFSRQVSIVTSYSCVESDIHRVIEILLRGDIDLRTMVTDRFAISDAPEAIEYARTSRTAIKTMISSGP